MVKAKDSTKRPTVSDSLGEAEYEGLVPMALDDILGTQVYLHGFLERDGDYGAFIVILCSNTLDGEKFVTTTGGVVVTRKLKLVRDKGDFPVIATFSKPEKYYDVR